MKQYVFLALAVLLAGCSEFDYTSMDFRADGERIVAAGIIDGETLDRFRDVVEDNPQIKTLVLQSVGGSVDDEANLIFSKAVRDAGFTTIVPSNGMVASGGTDLFLAGNERVLEPGACVGVHSWSDGIIDGKDAPRSDPEHQKYLQYYQAMGIDQGFYWFTLEAAPASDIHWMTAAEANHYGMATGEATLLAQKNICNDR